MNDVSILRAFLAGAVSVLSPCVLYLIPLYAALMGGLPFIAAKQRPYLRIAGLSAAYFAGFALIFTGIAVSSVTVFGEVFFDSLRYLRIAGGVLTILSGLFSVGVLFTSNKSVPISAVYGCTAIIGMGVSAGWTPCGNPALNTILLAASTPGSILIGVIFLSIYTMGMAAPFMLLGTGIASLIHPPNKQSMTVKAVQILSGGALLFYGILLLTDNLRPLTAMLPDFRLSY